MRTELLNAFAMTCSTSRAVVTAGASFLFAAVLCCAPQAGAQRIGSVGGERVTSAAPNLRAGGIAHGPGGESAGSSGIANSEVTGHVLSGKSAGYGERLSMGAREMASPGGTPGFSSSGDFPDTDFVATMPKPTYLPMSSGSSSFGVSLSSGGASGSRAFSGSSGGHYGGANMPVSHLRSAEAILNPFTRPIGGSYGTMPSIGIGSSH